jgi:hypothetical protein
MELSLSPDQFLDVGILAGFSLCRTLPTIEHTYSFREVIDLVHTFRTGITVIEQSSSSAAPQMKYASYREEFLRARQAIRYGFVLTTEGTCLPLALTIPSPQVASAADVPADIDKIFSPRLPDELYFYMCKGVISPAVVAWLTTGNVYEPLPLSDSQEYHQFIQQTITEGVGSPRVLSLAILLDALHPQWRERRIVRLAYTSVVRWLMSRWHTITLSLLATTLADLPSPSITQERPSLSGNCHPGRYRLLFSSKSSGARMYVTCQ